MSLYARLGLNFDTSKFGQASELSSGASNTLNLVANASGGKLPDWQLSALSSGPISRSTYFKNPTANLTINIAQSVNSIVNTANMVGDLTTESIASSLVLEISKFNSHTNNISGSVAVSNTYFPSLQSAQNIGQLNMMTLSKSDGVQNTSAILGSFTSLFINPELTENSNKILVFAQEYANSINAVSTVDEQMVPITIYTSNLANTEIINIRNYLANTQTLMTNRRTGDWDFYHNSMQLSQDMAFMQQFNNMGGTMTYLVNNVVGTSTLVNNLNS